jgi:hypothetical protein
MARKVPKGAMELRAGPLKVAGAQTAATRTRSRIATYTGR